MWIFMTLMAFGFSAFVLLLVNKWIRGDHENDHEIEKLKLQNETAKLEIEHMEIKMKLLEEENKRYSKFLPERQEQESAEKEVKPPAS